MKKILLAALIVVLPLACTTVPPGQSPETERALDELMERWTEGLRSENLDLMMSAYWPEAELVTAFPDGEQVFAGFDAIAAYQDGGFRGSDLFAELEVLPAGSEATPEGPRRIYEVIGPGFVMINSFFHSVYASKWFWIPISLCLLIVENYERLDPARREPAPGGSSDAPAAGASTDSPEPGSWPEAV